MIYFLWWLGINIACFGIALWWGQDGGKNPVPWHELETFQAHPIMGAIVVTVMLAAGGGVLLLGYMVYLSIEILALDIGTLWIRAGTAWRNFLFWLSQKCIDLGHWLVIKSLAPARRAEGRAVLEQYRDEVRPNGD